MEHELLVEPYPEVGSLSMFNVLYPRFANSKSTAEPITPAPTIMASYTVRTDGTAEQQAGLRVAA